MEFTVELIVEGALDDSFELADMEAVEALAEKLRAEAHTEDWAGELHFRPAHVESAGEFADDGSGVIPIGPSGEAAGTASTTAAPGIGIQAIRRAADRLTRWDA